MINPVAVWPADVSARKSIATVSLGGTLPEKLTAIASAGFAGVEIFAPNLSSFSGTARDVARQAQDLGLTIDLFQPLRDIEGVDDERFRANLDRAEQAFDIMDELGAPMVLICANTAPGVLDDDARAAAQLNAVAERARRRGLRVGFEALAWSTRSFTYDRALKVVKAADHPNLGLILDSFHTLIRPDDWSALSDVAPERIFYVQLGDAERRTSDPLTNRRQHSRLPGEGDLDVARFVGAVIQTGYGGTLSLEIFNEATSQSPPDAAHAGMASLRRIESLARRGIDEQ